MTPLRRTSSALAVLLVVALSSACGSSDDPSASSPAGAAGVSSGPTCTGGDVRLRQGVSTDLPGGGEAGIGQVHLDEKPPTVDLALGGAAPGETAQDLGVGDMFTMQGSVYAVDAICAGSVVLSVSP